MGCQRLMERSQRDEWMTTLLVDVVISTLRLSAGCSFLVSTSRLDLQVPLYPPSPARARREPPSRVGSSYPDETWGWGNETCEREVPTQERPRETVNSDRGSCSKATLERWKVVHRVISLHISWLNIFPVKQP